jgi:cbb3-type cytochrome oxidase cytochrome c subunit
MALRHETIGKNSLLLLLGILVAVSIGGPVEMVPLFTIGKTSRT